jgi:hypothetical protein
MGAILRAREVVAARPWSTSQEATTEHIGGLTFWLILVLAYGGGGAASTIVMLGKRLRNPIMARRRAQSGDCADYNSERTHSRLG